MFKLLRPPLLAVAPPADFLVTLELFSTTLFFPPTDPPAQVAVPPPLVPAPLPRPPTSPVPGRVRGQRSGLGHSKALLAEEQEWKCGDAR